MVKIDLLSFALESGMTIPEEFKRSEIKPVKYKDMTESSLY
jgi:hypothetical protein